MDSSHWLSSEIAEALERGSKVITGNQRAARTLRLAFDRQSRESGLSRWRPPEIYAWDTWTHNLWRQLLIDGRASRLLLNRSQELQVWSSIIGADAQVSSLQTVESLATMAADAWKLLCMYRGQQRLKSIGISGGDTRAFQRWAQTFVRRCQTDGYLAQAELEEALMRELASAGIGELSGIFLTGFDRLTPAQTALVEALKNTGVPVQEQLPGETAQNAFLCPAEDLPGELTAAAIWVRQFLESRPQALIAVIVPNLEADRGAIERTFRGILAPELQDITASNAARPFEFSLGRPLAQAPMIAVAMELARWVAGPLALANISRLLLSPYLAGSQTEQAARAEFDAFELRRLKLLQPELVLERFIHHAAHARHAGQLAGLLSQLRALQRAGSKLLPALDAASKQKPWFEWAEIIRQILEAAGWTSGRHLDSIEFQTREKWESALDELATLDFEGSRATYSGALAALESILKRTLFAPESHGAPVQIMSPREAAGSRFDAVCFLRASDSEWPVRHGTNPLLGWRVQRELGMPGSNAASDHEHSRNITARLATSAETIVFSYAKETVEGPQRPSPLLNDFTLETLYPPTVAAHRHVELETIQEDFVPLTNLSVRGGTDVLKKQAACGFRAFAEKRLNSTELRARDPGMDAAERGDVVHKSLEHFWGKVITQDALRAMSPEDRTAQLDRSIEYGLDALLSQRKTDHGDTSWETAYRDAQHKRHRRLLSRWLEEELKQPPFVVASREETLEAARVGPLTLTLRVDRVDHVADNGAMEMVVDYKTSRAKPNPWGGDRPDEPQLPLYAILRDPNRVAGITFARIRPGKEMKFNEFELQKKIKSDEPSTFAEQIEHWRQVLTSLATEFADGNAEVKPKDYPATCEHCGQRTLCRLDPAKLLGEYDEDDFSWKDDG